MRNLIIFSILIFICGDVSSMEVSGDCKNGDYSTSASACIEVEDVNFDCNRGTGFLKNQYSSCSSRISYITEVSWDKDRDNQNHNEDYNQLRVEIECWQSVKIDYKAGPITLSDHVTFQDEDYFYVSYSDYERGYFDIYYDLSFKGVFRADVRSVKCWVSDLDPS